MKRKDRLHLNLLCDIGELAALLIGSENIENFLQRSVEMVARHMDADVCSIYLFDEASAELVLNATLGLNPGAVGRIRMKIGEGLVGITLEKLAPVNEGSASRHPRFKYFQEAGEDPYESFLAVPIVRGMEKIGVLVVQHEQQNFFDEIDVLALRAIASQLAGAIGNARLLMEKNRRTQNSHLLQPLAGNTLFIKGQAASPGYAYAPLTVFDKSHVKLFSVEIDGESTLTLTDFRWAVKATVAQLLDLQTRFAKRLPESAALIFSAHLMILKDVRFVGEMENRIKAGMPPQAAVRAVAGKYIDYFSSSPHEYTREKAYDVQDLAGRILGNLKYPGRDDPFMSENRIVVAPELYPSDVLRLASEDIKGIVLVGGGVTGHVAILMHSLQLPLIIADQPVLLNLADGTPVIMDGETGNVYIRPSEEIVREFESQRQARMQSETLAKEMTASTCTRDGVRVRLLANINLLCDLALARELKAEGVGLYRTEFPFLIRSSSPSEEEQFDVYRHLFEEMAGKDVTIRTLDIGGDKLLAYTDSKAEANPALGLRAIRFSFRHRDVFHLQLRAILRAAAGAPSVRIMFPMISSLDEFEAARQAVRDCMADLARENFACHASPLTGVLVELPSITEIIDELAMEADFLSIGTNDFVQYMLAVDRTNEKVAEYYQPDHPAVLRSLTKIVKAAVGRSKDIAVCGEMAHEPRYIPFLLGIGVRTLSVHPKYLPVVQRTIRMLKISDAEAHARRLLKEGTISGVRNVLTRIA